ncbi:MAG: hypothetical protein CME64_05805 [Halobacteriovoraceae bacterium]|nr:hypothetical protein [Halobacteriovoraceae bacterium]|tara:strand:+ start:183094 stop:184458 length:1365 start_codon:yes stop_codon:yes gene_type:complete
MKAILVRFIALFVLVSCGAKVDDLDLQLGNKSNDEEIPSKIITVGSIDESFGGGDGYVVVSGSGAGDDDMKASAMYSDGKIVVVGDVDQGANGVDIAIWMFNPDGSLDTSFGGTGQVTYHSGGAYDDYARGVAVDSNGKILVTGAVETSSSIDMIVLRLNSDGSLDTSFGGGDGVFTHDGAAGVPNEGDEGFAIAIDSNQKIVVGGHSDSESGGGITTKAAVWRLNSNGSLDTTFNSVGYATGSDNTVANSLVIDSSNNIYLSGYSGALREEMRVWKFLSTGSLDPAYGTSGVASYDGYGFMNIEASYSITLDANEKVLIAGEGNLDLALLRFSTTGNLDSTFGSGGVVTHNNAAGGNGGDLGNDLVVDHEGKILVAGQSGNGSNGDLAIWKYNSDGTLDTSFNSVGYMTIDAAGGPSAHDEALSINLDETGHIIVTGLMHNGSDNDAVIWKIK